MKRQKEEANRVDFGANPDALVEDGSAEAKPIQELMRALVTEQFKQKR